MRPAKSMHVIEVFDTATSVAVIEKRLSTRDRNEPEAIARLHNEARLLRVLEGRATPLLLAAGEDERGPWLRMEKIPFPTLLQRIERAGGRPLEATWVEHAAFASFAALADLHEARDAAGALHLVHADISPANLLVDDAGARAVLLDLELASFRGAPRRDGSFRGTAGYCAPEIARGEPPTVASDLFGLGATWVHAASGRIPRDGPSLAALVAIAAERPLLGAAHVAGAALPAIILQCLAHDPAERPTSAREVLSRLGGPSRSER